MTPRPATSDNLAQRRQRRVIRRAAMPGREARRWGRTGGPALLLAAVAMAGGAVHRLVGPPRLPSGLPLPALGLPDSGDALATLGRLVALAAPDADHAGVAGGRAAVEVAWAAMVAAGLPDEWPQVWGPFLTWGAWLLFAVWALARTHRLLFASGLATGGTRSSMEGVPLSTRDQYRRYAAYGAYDVGIPAEEDGSARPNSLGELVVVTGVLIAGAAVALRVGGPPRLPAAFPGWNEVTQTLLGSELPPGAVAYAALMGWWAVWTWLAVSLALSLFVRASDALTAGAAWVRSLATLADRLSPPAVRRLADRVVVATVVVHLAARTPAVEAAPPALSPMVSVSAPEPDIDAHRDPGVQAAGRASEAIAEPAARAQTTVHVVRPGDTLWAIAGRYYGHGALYPRLVEANLGRVMPTGERFVRGDVIRPGWTLMVPAPTACFEEVEGDVVYTVAPGDSLSGIAERFLGDADCWRGIYALNRGMAHLPDGRTLTDPGLIWPGLPLRLPRSAPVASALAAGAPEPRPFADEAQPEVTLPSRDDVVPAPFGDASVHGGEGAPMLPGVSSGAVVTDPESAAASQVTGARDVAPALEETVPAAPLPSEMPPAGGDMRLPGGTAVQNPASLSTPPVPAGALAAVAAAGSLVASSFLVRRWLRSRGRLRVWPGAAPSGAVTASEDEVVLGGGFAEAEFGPVLAHRLLGDEVEPAVVGAEHVLRFLHEQGVRGASLLTAVQGRPAGAPELHLTLAVASPAEEERVLALTPEIGARLGGAGRAQRTPDGDIRLALTDVRSLALLAPGGTGVPEAGGDRAPLLVALGAPSRRHLLYANWRECGHVLVAGQAGAGVHTVLTSLVAALAARCHPRALRLCTVGTMGPAVAGVDDEPGGLPSAVDALPHQDGPRVAPDDRQAVAHLARTLRDELARRRERIDESLPASRLAADDSPAVAASAIVDGGGVDATPGALALGERFSGPDTAVGLTAVAAHAPDVVVVVEDLASPGAAVALEELIAAVGPDGPRHGLFLLAATTQPDSLGDDLLDAFGTRLVLAVPDAATSRRLCGVADADLLDAGGHLLLCLDGRAPLQLRGFRLPPEGLEQLVRLMIDAFPEPPRPSGVAGRAPITEAPLASEPGPSEAVNHPGSMDAPARQPSADGPVAATTGATEPHPPAREDSGHSHSHRGAREPAASPSPEQSSGESGEGAPPIWEPGGTPAATRLRPAGVGGVAEGVAVAPPADAGTPILAASPGVPTAAAPTLSELALAQTPDRSSAFRGPSALADMMAPEVGVPEISTEPGAATARLYVRCFGTLEVRAGAGPGGCAVTSRGDDGHAHRSWEVLALLAAQPHGEIATERVLGAVWPEATTSDGLRALHTALSRLRSRLIEQVPGLPGAAVRQERSGVCRLDPGLVATDVGRFVALCAAARRAPPAEAAGMYETARTLYRGHLLETPGYPWVHDPGDDGVSLAEHYRVLHRRATQALARLYEETDRPDQATPLYEELVRVDPTDTETVHRLLRLHHRLGDRLALVRTIQDLKGWLRMALADPDEPEDAGGTEGDAAAYAPDSETLRLYEELRGDLEQREATAGALA